MTSTAILIALGILIILVVVYFAVNKRVNLATLRRLTGPPIPILDRIVADYMNLPRRTVVQRSGNYECIICANGGVQDSTAAALFGEAEARRRAKARKSTRTFFEKNSKLPSCPNCGDDAGWTLVKQ
jgi:hypothetical protein